MQSENEETPVFTATAVLAMVVFSSASYWHGTDTNWQSRASTLPHFVHMLADGLEHLPRYWLAITGLVIAVGASLGASELRSSIRKCAWGAAWASSLCVIATFWSYLSTAGSMTSGMGSGGGLGIATLIAVFIAFISVAASAALITWAPIAIAAITSSIIVHALLNIINGLPLPWQVQEGETVPDPSRVVTELGMVAVVFAVFGGAFGLIPGFNMPQMGAGEPETVQSIWENLDQIDPQNTWQLTAPGRKRIATSVDRIIEQRNRILRDPCDVQAARSFASGVNLYFRNVRIYENWQPGQELSEQSRRVVQLATTALQNKQIGWDALRPQARIHLNAEKYSSVSYEYPLSCP